MRRSAFILASLTVLLLGVRTIVPAARQLAQARLPADVEATLVPIAQPTRVNLGHLGNQPVRGWAISEQEGVAIVNSPLISALAEYGRLTQTKVVHPPTLPIVNVNFRGQDRPKALARALAETMRTHGVRLVDLGDDRVAAVGADVPLIRGDLAGNAAATGRLSVGLLLVVVALFLGFQSIRSLSVRTTSLSQK